MNKNVELNEFKRRLDIRKMKFVEEMRYFINVFDVDDKKYIKEFNSLSDDMLNIGLKYFEIRNELNNCDMKCEKLKKSILLNENIDVEDKISSYSNEERRNIINKLFSLGFINNNECEMLLENNWNKRYKVKFSD